MLLKIETGKHPITRYEYKDYKKERREKVQKMQREFTENWHKSAGAHRYLLRIETSDPELYKELHPSDHSLERRIQCLRDLKACGYLDMLTCEIENCPCTATNKSAYTFALQGALQ